MQTSELAEALPQTFPFSTPDLGGIGLVLAVVGSFLLANSILFRHPRALVREHFGKSSLHLRKIREYIFHRVQVTVGFAFLLSGFTLQLFGRYRPLPPETVPEFPTMWVGLIVVLGVGMLGAAWWWSLWAFRRYVRQYFLENPVDFEVEGGLAREVGQLFGVNSYGDDTVQEYAKRLRVRIGLPPQAGRVVPSIRPLRPVDEPDEAEMEDIEERLG